MSRDKAGFRRFFHYLKETDLVEPLREICVAHSVLLSDAYGDSKGPTAHAARLECWAWLHFRVGKSSSEIARIFDREHTSILYGFRQMRAAAVPRDVTFTIDTARVLARDVASRSSAAMSAAGRRVSAARNTDPRRCPDCQSLLRIRVHAHCPSQNAPGTPSEVFPAPEDPPGGKGP